MVMLRVRSATGGLSPELRRIETERFAMSLARRFETERFAKLPSRNHYMEELSSSSESE